MIRELHAPCSSPRRVRISDRGKLTDPAYHLNQGMTDVLVRGQPASAVLPPTGILAAFAVGVTLIAAWLFRWDSV